MLRRHSQPSDRVETVGRQSLEARARLRLSFWFWLIPILLVVMGMAAYGIKGYRSSSGTDETDEAVKAAQRIVRAQFGLGVVTHFAERRWSKVEREGDQYIVSGWLEALPKNGADGATYDYSCAVFRNPDGDWTALRMDLQPQ
jgi:heme/copper-type cytochrome/quinol oxidase subunit 1